MIHFSNWELCAHGQIARQYDHLSRRLEVLGELPEGWDWAMLVQVDGNMDIIPMEPMEGGVGVTLTRDQLSIGDRYYKLQLRGARGEQVRHTNVVRAFVPRSLSGDGQWPTVPSEFSQLEQSAWEAANKAEAIAGQIVGDEAWIYSEVGGDGHLYLVQGDAFGGAEFAVNGSGELEVTYE